MLYLLTRNRLPLVAVCAIALLFAGCRAKHENAQDQAAKLAPAKVKVQKVEVRSEATVEEVVGTLRAKTSATLEARVSGRITQFPVNVGQSVKSGELIARLEAAEFSARQDQAEAAQQQAERDWQRTSSLYQKQAATRAEFDAATAHRRQARANAAEAKAMASYLEVRAPFAGVVTKKWAEAGEQAAPGKPLVTLDDPAELQLEADLPEALQVPRDALLGIQVDGVPGEIAGKVREVAPSADTVSRTRRVKLDLVAKPGLMPGQFARLRVPVGQGESLRVPVAAVVQRGQLEIVFVVAEQRAQMHLVKTGRRFGDTWEILSGLNAGDSVVATGAEALRDGQPVEAQ